MQTVTSAGKDVEKKVVRPGFWECKTEEPITKSS